MVADSCVVSVGFTCVGSAVVGLNVGEVATGITRVVVAPEIAEEAGVNVAGHVNAGGGVGAAGCSFARQADAVRVIKARVRQASGLNMFAPICKTRSISPRATRNRISIRSL